MPNEPIQITLESFPPLPASVSDRVARWPTWLMLRILRPVRATLTCESKDLWPQVLAVVDESGRSVEVKNDLQVTAIVPPLCPVHPRLTADEARWITELPSHVTAKSSPTAQTALKAGLLQWHDALDLSHQQSQSIENAGQPRDGDYWHAIMHRREPDPGNAKYWFRAVGRHPLFPVLGETARELFSMPSTPPEAASWKSRLTPSWNPNAFVDLCETARAMEDSPLSRWVCQLQMAEMLLLLDWTARS